MAKCSINDPDIKVFMSTIQCTWSHGMGLQAWSCQMVWAMCSGGNGLRPARYQIDKFNDITIASETGVNPIDNDSVISKGESCRRPFSN